MSSKYARKRKRDLDEDTTKAHGRGGGDRDSSPSDQNTKRSRHRSGSSGNDDGGGGGGTNREESLSIAETNKIRAELGLDPLELDDGSSKAAAGNDEENEAIPPLAEGETLFTEDGIKIVHKAPKNAAEVKQTEKLKERLDIQKQRRQIQSKVLKVKRTLADDSDSDEGGAAAWVEKSRRLEERRKADQQAKQLDEQDEIFGIGGLAEDEQRKRVGRDAPSLASLVVAHSQHDFKDGRSVELVLADKEVLDEDDEEVLINSNMLENARHKHNVELRKRKSNYKPYEEGDAVVDEFGESQPTKQNILSKYDEGVDTKKKDGFRLDTSGGYDLDKETHETEVRRRLLMSNKKVVSLEPPKLTLANEFYTQEEMVAFRRPKKKKDGQKIRKRGKTLKASDLIVEGGGEAGAGGGETKEKEMRLARLEARRREQISIENATHSSKGSFKPIEGAAATKNGSTPDVQLEEGELPAPVGTAAASIEIDSSGFKQPTRAEVDLQKLKRFADKTKADTKMEVDESQSESDDGEEEDLIGGVNLTGVQIDDDAEDELGLALERARRQRLMKLEKEHQSKAATAAVAEEEEMDGAAQVHKLLARNAAIKQENVGLDGEDMDDESATDAALRKHQIIFDSTSEQYKLIGETPTFGLAGNRGDVNHQMEEDEIETEQKPKVIEVVAKAGEAGEKRHRRHRHHSSNDSDSGGERKRDKKKRSSRRHHHRSSGDAPSSSKAHKSHKSHRRKSGSSSPSDDKDYKNVLGEEKDVTKGVAAMLKLAAIKGYLQPGGSKNVGEGSLKHLESRTSVRVEQSRYEIDDKVTRKLERMGTTGRGPITNFDTVEKRNYEPNVEIKYSDPKGRLMGSKEAFRALSWKFHGKGPGKKQMDKHQSRLDKKERLKKMNSFDTPLGTLSKQLKKQEQLQTPYLILTGSGRDGAPLQKE